jgi:hypothetical protein
MGGTFGTWIWNSVVAPPLYCHYDYHSSLILINVPHQLCFFTILTWIICLCIKVVATLLSHGCSTLIPDANGWIPVCYALWRENTACVLLLLKVNDDNSLKQLRVSKTSSSSSSSSSNYLSSSSFFYHYHNYLFVHFHFHFHHHRLHLHLFHCYHYNRLHHHHHYLLNLMQALGQLLLQHTKDNRLRNTVMALASIPDLFLLINSLVRRTHTLLDGDHLNFIFAHTNILNLDNKLIVARRMISAINNQDNPVEHVRNGSTYESDYGHVQEYEYEYEFNLCDDVAFPIIESTPCPNAFILLARDNPWKSLFFFATGFTDSTGQLSYTCTHMHTHAQIYACTYIHRHICIHLISHVYTSTNINIFT